MHLHYDHKHKSDLKGQGYFAPPDCYSLSVKMNSIAPTACLPDRLT